MFLHERFQAFCQFCHNKFEADTADAAILLAMAHERDKHVVLLSKRAVAIEDFYA